MIVPGQFSNLIKRPHFSLSWTFVVLNILVFAGTSFFFTKWPSVSLGQGLKDKNFAVSISEMHQQTLDPIERKGTPVPALEALRDHRFWKKVRTFPFTGDQVQIEKNRAMLLKFQEEYYASSQYQLGLGALETSPWAWVTYQFTHASIIHLVGNVLFIFLIISYLELEVGFFWLVSIYLLGGFGGGLSYLLFEGAGNMAMVGGSASASALMAFLMLIKNNKLIPWSYLLAPVPRGYGVIYLPAFFIFPFYIMSDFIAVLWEPAGLQSAIAVSAHIGGVFVGLILGIIYLTEEKLKKYFIRTGVLLENDLTDEGKI